MRQTKITLANVLLIVATAGFGFATFLSMNFLTLGNIKESLMVAGITTLVLGGLAFAAQMFKRAHRNFKTSIVFEILSLILFVSAAALTIQTFSHVFTVFERKQTIESNVTTSIAQAKEMFAKYEDYALLREDTYKSTLEAVVANKSLNPTEYGKYGFDDSSGSLPDIDQIDVKTFTLHNKLFPPDYENDTITGELGVNGAAEQWLSDANSSVKNDFGFMFGIVNILNEVPVKTEAWKTYLIVSSQFRADGETAADFDYTLSFETIKNQLTEKESPTILSIVVACLAYFLMLLPYFLAERSSRYPGFKLIFGGSDDRDNEL
jgi:hypothetical protein